MNTSSGQSIAFDIMALRKFARMSGKYLFMVLVLFQGVIGVEEMVSLKHLVSETHYGPVLETKTTNTIEKISSTMQLDTYNFNKASSFYRSLSTSYISAIDKSVLHSAVLKTIPRPLRKSASLYISDIFHFSEKNNLDPIWVLSIIWTESHFKPRASSIVSATGLMQIMPNTGTFLSRLLKRPNDKKLVMQLLNDPRSNVELGTFYLKRLLTRFKTHRYATVAYNMGPGFVSRRLRTGLPVGTKNHYFNKVKRYYRILLSGVHSLEKESFEHGQKSILKFKSKMKPIKYYLGYDLRFLLQPRYAKR